MCTVGGAWSIGWKGMTEPEMGPECLAAESKPSENFYPRRAALGKSCLTAVE